VLHEQKGITADRLFGGSRGVAPAGRHWVARVPLLGKGEPLGLVYLENDGASGAIWQEDLELLCAISTQPGISIENELFSDELSGLHQVLERLVEEQTTTLRDAELKLYQTEKMASLSRLVAGGCWHRAGGDIQRDYGTPGNNSGGE
jgi:hypothetical protein